jgi:RND family efflux transporter MFP subunit
MAKRDRSFRVNSALAKMAALSLALTLAACKKAQVAAEARPVRTMVIEEQSSGEPVALTGQIAAHQYVSASFRIAGKMIERMVGVGSVVKAGQPIARLDATIEKDTLAQAEAELEAAKANLEQSELSEQRADALVKNKAVSQSSYDDALRQLRSARAQRQAAEAKLHSAREQLGFAILKAEIDGVVTEKCAEPGEVVGAGQAIVRIAGTQPMDAQFDVPESLVSNGIAPGQSIEVRLNSDPTIRAEATIYEIAPQSDSATRTYLMKAAIAQCPPKMLLGATVVGEVRSAGKAIVRVQSASLTTTAEGQPAVWRVEPKTLMVQLVPVVIERFTTDAAVIVAGLRPGDVVVTAGVQALHQNQKIKLL